MATQQEDPWYVAYGNYNDVLKHYDKAIDYDYDERPLDEVISYMNTQNYNIKKEYEIILKFFRLLRKDDVYMYGLTKHYCKYINFWLNKEYRKEINQNKLPNFDVFRTFVSKLNHVKFVNKDNSCEEYINPLDSDTIIKIDFLYLLYDLYNKINNPQTIRTDLNNACSKLAVLTRDYRESIYAYYVYDKDLYNKLENIKKLIEEKTGSNSPCKESISFIKPTILENLLNEEAQKKAEEEARKQAAEKEKQALEAAAARQAREEEDRERQKLLQSNDLSLSSSRDNQSQEMRQEYGELPSTRYPAGSRELDTTRLQGSTQRHVYSGRPESSTELLLEEDHTKDDMGLQREVVYEQPGTDRTRSGILGGSSGIQGYITEVLGSVEPGPVLGVSGGMGALFLLFKYTPFGSFFGGRRRRMHQIPRTFGGFPPGEFPNFHEYDGGFIGYAPMNINPLAE